VSGEDAAELDALRERMVERLHPVCGLESELVDRVVACMWRLRRCYQVEAAVFDRLASPLYGQGIGAAWVGRGGAMFLTLTRYEQAIERSMFRALSALQRMREEGGGDDGSRK
jgi:hypothetical protein